MLLKPLKNLIRDLIPRVIPAGLLDIDRQTLSELCVSLQNKQGRYSVLQIGANDGVRHDPLAEIIARDHPRCWLVEPIPEYFDSLNRKYQEHINVTCINACISATDGDIIMYMADPTKQVDDWQHGIASLDPEHFKRSNSAEELMIPKNVKSITFDTMIKNHKMTELDVLVTDCEGYDLDLMRMFPFQLLHPRVIQVEMDTRNVYSPSQCAELIQILVQNGYHMIRKGEVDLLAWKA